MASYARTHAQQAQKIQMSVLAQAKPAIISASSNNFDIPTGCLSERLNATLKFSHQQTSHEIMSRDITNTKFNYDTEVRHIEDENIIHKQNASNQMRQAAVMAASASQQKVRLSATERLALTAKKPITATTTATQLAQTNQQYQQQQHQSQPLSLSQPQQQQQQQPKQQLTSNVPPVPNPKPSHMPTLETLLAVQRELHQHTRQHLNSVPQHKQQPQQQQQQMVNHKQQEFTNLTIMTVQQQQQRNNKPLPPSPTKSPNLPLSERMETYDKDLPPLPPSISPSTSTDDSQLNSLDSNSPATSLVSIPPPPPLSSYLQQYDEVNNNACYHGNISNNNNLNQSSTSSPTPSTPSTTEVSSIKQVSPLPIKSTVNLAPVKSSFELPLPFVNQATAAQSFNNCNSKMPATCPASQKPYYEAHPPVHVNTNQYFLQSERSISNYGTNNTPPIAQQQNFDQLRQQAQQTQAPQQNRAPIKPQLQVPSRPKIVSQVQMFNQMSFHKPQLNYQQHLFTQDFNSSSPFVPPLPPQPQPPSSTQSSVVAADSGSSGFDEPDCANFRFPTPPPPDLLLDGTEDDFQCKIPTPPPHQSMSVASFADLHCSQLQQPQLQQQQMQSPPSAFSVASAANVALQPPPLFRQQQQQQHHRLASLPVAMLAPGPPQLTVHINNEGSLLSTANPNHPSVNHHHHHHHIMMTMTASSSASPSSSSDGDGHSSNSSSSTSGIHSSIDSPSSSNSKLDDFNYGGKLKKPSNSSHQHHEVHYNKENNNNSGSNLNMNNINMAASIHSVSSVTSIGRSGSISSTSSINFAASVASTAATRPRPALKQKKTVSFSDKVEMVACAEEQSEDHLPNPLLARVLSGKLQ